MIEFTLLWAFLYVFSYLAMLGIGFACGVAHQQTKDIQAEIDAEFWDAA